MLDRAALVACWREALLAQKVLLGETKGYRNHPQLDRFRAQPDPVASIGSFLAGIADEADARGYNFNRSKTVRTGGKKIPVTDGQLGFELEHLRQKVTQRAPGDLERLQETPIPAHPILETVPGDIEDWERAATNLA